jgi:hypothetical protein
MASCRQLPSIPCERYFDSLLLFQLFLVLAGFCLRNSLLVLLSSFVNFMAKMDKPLGRKLPQRQPKPKPREYTNATTSLNRQEIGEYFWFLKNQLFALMFFNPIF